MRRRAGGELGAGYGVWYVMGSSELPCFPSAVLQRRRVWQELMDLEKDAVVAAARSGNSRPGGDRGGSASCLAILPATSILQLGLHRAYPHASSCDGPNFQVPLLGPAGMLRFKKGHLTCP